MKNITVKNSAGQELNFDEVNHLMDFNLSEEVYRDGDQEPQAFFNNYCAAHFAKFGEEFECDKSDYQL